MLRLKRLALIAASAISITTGMIAFSHDDVLARGGGRAGGGRSHGSGRSYSGGSGRSSSGGRSNFRSGGRVNVRSYMRKDGTFVRGYTRSAPAQGAYSGQGSYTSGVGSYSNPPSGINGSSSGIESSTYPYPENLGGLKVHPRDKDAYTSPDPNKGMGLAYTGGGNVDSYQMYMDWGIEATKQRQYGTALHWFERALSIRPNSDEAKEAIRTIRPLVGQTQ